MVVADVVARLLAGDDGACEVGNAFALAMPQLRLLRDQLLDLIAARPAAPGGIEKIPIDRSVRAARLRAMKADIAANLDRDDLTVNTLATRHGVTPRYVQLLFDREGTTFTDFLREQRLSLAHRRLTDARFADRSITSIAFDVGFGDLSYFNRLFRRRFRCSPTDVRKAEWGSGSDQTAPRT